MLYSRYLFFFFFFFFNDTATTEIYTLSLHDALPISQLFQYISNKEMHSTFRIIYIPSARMLCRLSADRKSTRLNSSHLVISYAVFCLKKKKKNITSLHLHNYDYQRYIQKLETEKSIA